ncbi:MAG: SLBB domain-containing protein, partial [Pseudonocardiaceae bacterium]
MANPLADPADPFRAGRHSARARLVGLRDPADRAREPTSPAWRSARPADEPLDSTQPLDSVEPDGPTEQRSGRGEHRRPAERPVGHLVRRWTPGPVRDARWDPGRPGALMLSAVTALAAVLAAVGVWWGRPVAEPVPALPVLPAAAPASAPPAPGAPSGELVISVVGRVATPGLVRVPDGARVADALDAAGGALPGTD